MLKLSSQETQLYIVQLESILASKKLFLRHDFSMPELAEQTGIPIYIISYIVNSELKVRFTDYINLKRLDYFKQKIKDPSWEDLTLTEMTGNSGFRCRTTCYRAFAKHLKTSPSKYLESYRKSIV